MISGKDPITIEYFSHNAGAVIHAFGKLNTQFQIESITITRRNSRERLRVAMRPFGVMPEDIDLPRYDLRARRDDNTEKFFKAIERAFEKAARGQTVSLHVSYYEGLNKSAQAVVLSPMK